MEQSALNLPAKKDLSFLTQNKRQSRSIKLVVLFFGLLMMSLPLQAQESGPLLMKQELGYTLGGGVFGAGMGVVVWFMDPLNPEITLRSTVKDGLIVGTALGALFGFYMLQNALIFPSDSVLPENLDQLLGSAPYVDEHSPPVHRSLLSQDETSLNRALKLRLFEFRF